MIDRAGDEICSGAASAFGKTKLLQPGETEILTLTVTVADMASYHTDTSEWITDGGTYTLKLGTSSRDIKQSLVFKVAADVVVEKDHKVLQPEGEISELKK